MSLQIFFQLFLLSGDERFLEWWTWPTKAFCIGLILATVMNCFGPAGKMEGAYWRHSLLCIYDTNTQLFNWFISFLFFGSQLISTNPEFGSCWWMQLHSCFHSIHPFRNGGRLRQIHYWGLTLFFHFPCFSSASVHATLHQILRFSFTSLLRSTGRKLDSFICSVE